MKRKPIVAITSGDPIGIGPEVVVKALRCEELHRICSLLVISDVQALEQISNRLGLAIDLHVVEDLKDCSFKEGSAEVLHMGNLPDSEIPWGSPCAIFCKTAIEYVETAIDLCVAGTVDAMVTAPVNKGELVKAGFTFTGHTELLARRTGVEDYAMMLAGEGFRVVLATTHIPLIDVSSHINKEKLLSLLRLINRSMPLFGIAKPRIGVAALNPHAGEEGAMGKEEVEEIIPAILKAGSEGIDARGPYPADSLFIPSNRENYDVFLAMYHDQGLIPLKAESFQSAVNITLGLPIVRTSVDHGTAYEIAGRGLADPTSLINAVKVAAGLAQRRNRSSE